MIQGQIHLGNMAFSASLGDIIPIDTVNALSSPEERRLAQIVESDVFEIILFLNMFFLTYSLILTGIIFLKNSLDYTRGKYG